MVTSFVGREDIVVIVLIDKDVFLSFVTGRQSALFLLREVTIYMKTIRTVSLKGGHYLYEDNPHCFS